jgi:hypothetical protein
MFLEERKTNPELALEKGIFQPDNCQSERLVQNKFKERSHKDREN